MCKPTHAVNILFLYLLCFSAARASVNLRIGNDVLVKTTGSVLVKIDGTLTETGTGYLRGKISSGARSNMDSFAGLTLGAGLDGSIVRTTGSVYAEGNGEGTNFKRFYEINNSGGSAITGDLDIVFVSTGDNDERNGLEGPFFVYRYASDWTGYGNGRSASPVSAGGVQIPTGVSEWVISEGIRVAATLFLEGPYSEASNAMTTSIHDSIPTTSPYSQNARSVSSVPSGVTDWVLVQLRSSADGSSLASRSCFVRANGSLVADDGVTAYVGVRISPGDYYLVIQHRNHLAVMTAAAVSGLTWGATPSTYDFTTGTNKYYGSDAALLETNVYGMYGGDGNNNGFVNAVDKNSVWRPQNGTFGYKDGDFNLDGFVTALDKNGVWRSNNGKGSQVPSL